MDDTTRRQPYEELLRENAALRGQLEDATETLEAIRTGAVDALVVQRDEGHELYTLQTADAGYRAFIEAMNEGAVTVSEDGFILYSNAAFARMSGAPAGAVLGHRFQDFVPPEAHAILANLLERGWDCGAKVELTIVGAAQPVPCLLSVKRLPLEEGAVLSIILTDLTAQKAAEEQLKEKAARLQEAVASLETSNHDLQQFASVASHDLQEPLRKIALFGGMLRKSLAEKLKGADALALDKIITSSARLKTMVGDVLSFSRLAAPQSPDGDGATEQADLTRIVADLLEDFEVLIEERGAVVETGPLPVAAVPAASIRQVLQNLLSNALKFSRAGVPCRVRIGTADASRVEKAFRDDKQYVLVSVADNGIGFDERFRDRIFDLFQRLNAKDAYEGSGIGLAVAKRLTERAGGAIRVWSVEGEGTEFVLVLPVGQ